MKQRNMSAGGSPAHAGMHPPCGRLWRYHGRLPRPRGDAPPQHDTTSVVMVAPPPTRGCTRGGSSAPGHAGGSPAHAGMHPHPTACSASTLRLPRPRGDAPFTQPIFGKRITAPPPTRGCTPQARHRRFPHHGSPAHAGMHPAPRRSSSIPTWLPRPRGDAPGPTVATMIQAPAPPPTRGCTRQHLKQHGDLEGSPAHAGMHPMMAGGKNMRPGLPRPRGDAPRIHDPQDVVDQAPPPTRGCTRGCGWSWTGSRGSPAHAGMHPPTIRFQTPVTRLPRPRGDAPSFDPLVAALTEAPPPTRGCTLEFTQPQPERLGSPAHAGMHPSSGAPHGVDDRLPRPRGDAPDIEATLRKARAAPPPTRGCTRAGRCGSIFGGGSPAHAGMHPRRTRSWVASDGLPRPRGDAPGSRILRTPGRLAPPPTRGCTRVRYSLRRRAKGSPAHAGMHPIPIRRHSTPRGLPRPRGDAPVVMSGATVIQPAPPPTRGCTRRSRAVRPAGPGSPAHAGMHPWPTSRAAASSRLPRPRGDAPKITPRIAIPRAAPPPTRGCTLVDPLVIRDDDGSPAHAGMHPAPRRTRCRLTRLPRPRGDAPSRIRIVEARNSAPPPTRGCTRRIRMVEHWYIGSPAHAGMHPCSVCGRREGLRLPRPRGDAPRADGRWIAAVRLPRPRGDAPLDGTANLGMVSAPPPTRGCTLS